MAKRPKNGNTALAKKISPYDSENAKKQVGLQVILVQGKQLFPDNCKWRWKTIAKETMLEIFIDDTVLAQYARAHVVGVTGPNTLFRDAEWR